MGLIVRILFPIIAYICVATVITLGAGYGYLRQSGALDDQRMFRIVSLLHGIDLDQVAEDYESSHTSVPPEELSYDQRQEQVQIASLHIHAKQDELEKEISEFNNRFRELGTRMDRFNKIQNEVEHFFDQRRNVALESGIVAVRNQIKNLVAKKQAKPILIKMLKEKRTDQVILLLNGMSLRNRTDILKTFTSEEEVEMLYHLQKQMLAGDPEKSFLDEKLKEFERGQGQN